MGNRNPSGLARAKAQSKRKTPDRFEAGLLASCFDHAQMRARDTSKPAEQLLRHILFHPKPPDRLADSVLLILHMIASFQSSSSSFGINKKILIDT